MTELLKTLKYLTDRGLYLFPCIPNGKTPWPGQSWKRVSTRDMVWITNWMKHNPGSNWGIDCGKSGITAPDVDCGGGKKGAESYDSLDLQHGFPDTFSVRTASGGFHYLYLGATRNRIGMLPGLDIKSVGGFLVAPGSAINGVKYEIVKDIPFAPAPGWLVSIIGEYTERDPRKDIPACEIDNECAIFDATEYAMRAEPAIGGTGEGLGENRTYRIACRMRDFGVSKETCLEILLTHWNDRCVPLWEIPDLEKKISNAYEYAKGQIGNASPEAKFAEATTIFEKTEPTAEGPAEPLKKAPIDPLFSWRGVGRFLDTPPLPQEYIFENLLPKRVTGAIFATGGVGKTSLALQLSCCLATGIPFGPFKPVRPTKVLFIGGEDAEDIFHRRLFRAVPAMGMRANEHETLLRENLEVVSLVGQDRVLTMLDAAGNPKATLTFARLQETLRSVPDIELVIIDPKSRFDGTNENDNSHATYFVACLEKLVADHGITVLFSHHESKATVREGEIKSSSGRGASALRDGVRWALSLGDMGEKESEKFGVAPFEYIEAAITKNNYGQRWPDTSYFRRDNEGVLSPADLHSDRNEELAEALVHELSMSQHQFTAAELEARSKSKERTEETKKLSERIGKKFSGYTRGKDMRRAIEHALFRGKLVEAEVLSGKITKSVLIVPSAVRAEHVAAELEKESELVEMSPPPAMKKKGKKNG